MLRRVIAAVLAVLGLAAIGLATASATVWRPDDGVVADAAGTDVSTLLVTAPGVLELVDPQVTVEASRPDGGRVVLAVGREVDVTGWVGDDAHAVVTGLASWESLATSFVEGETEPVEPAEEDADADDAESSPAEDDAEGTPAEEADDAAADATTTSGPSGIVGPDPYGSDMWLARAEGEGSAQLEWTAPETGRYLLLAASVGDDAPPPAVTLSWPREVSTPLLVPGVAVGSVLLLIAAGLGVLELRRSRRVVSAPVETGAVPVQPAEGQPVLTRSALRVARSAGTSPSATAASAPTSAVPAVTAAQVPGWRRVDLVTGEPGDRGESDGGEPADSAAPSDSAAPTASAPTGTSPSPTTPAAQTAPMSRRELRERAEREAALRAQERARSRRWHRKGDRGASAPTAASGTPVVASTESAATPVVTGIAPQTKPASSATPAGATDSAEPARADAWRKAWGFDTSWSPQGPAAPRGDGQDDATSTDAGDER